MKQLLAASCFVLFSYQVLPCAAQNSNSPSNFFKPWPTPLSGDIPHFVSVKEVVYKDESGRKWHAPEGTQTDGASIPQAALSFIGDRYDIRWRSAALVHDAYCGEANKKGSSYHRATWQDVHRMFYNACLAGNTPVFKAKLMYAAIWLFGPSWTFAEPARAPSGKRDTRRLELAKEIREFELRMQQLEIDELNITTVDSLSKADRFAQLRAYIQNDTTSTSLVSLDEKLLSARRELHAQTRR